jgi:PAS domain S-box-containing protein
VLFVVVGALIAALNGALRAANARCEREADAARKSEARARRLAEANLIGVFFCDMEGNIRWANDEFLRLLGKTSADLQVRPINWRDMTAPEHRARDENALRELRDCHVCTPFEKDHILSDGRRIPVLCGCAIVSETSDVVGFVLDLTERNRAEAEAKLNQERLRTVGAELMMAEERERRRIAAVLHDSVVQMLALAKMRAGQLLQSADGNVQMAERLKEVYQLVETSITQSRTLIADLSPPVLYELGLAAAIQWLGDRMRSEHGIVFELKGDRQKKLLTDETRTTLFQAVRELIVNVVKHSGATRCIVTICRDESAGAIRIEVQDNGRGFVPAAAEAQDYSKGGFGLFNMRQRLAHLGGTFQVAQRPGGGTVVTISAPLARTDPEVSHEHNHSPRGRSPVDAPRPAQHA